MKKSVSPVLPAALGRAARIRNTALAITGRTTRARRGPGEPHHPRGREREWEREERDAEVRVRQRLETAAREEHRVARSLHEHERRHHEQQRNRAEPDRRGRQSETRECGGAAAVGRVAARFAQGQALPPLQPRIDPLAKKSVVHSERSAGPSVPSPSKSERSQYWLEKKSRCQSELSGGPTPPPS